MPNLNELQNNECQYTIRGEFDINSSAAVIAQRGTAIVVTKTGTGTYTAVLKNSQIMQLVEILHREANYSATVPATALGVFVSTVTQSTTTSDITITLVTTALPTSGAATDGTAATTITYEVVIRTCQMNSPI
jgi:hypothetical protein